MSQEIELFIYPVRLIRYTESACAVKFSSPWRLTQTAPSHYLTTIFREDQADLWFIHYSEIRSKQISIWIPCRSTIQRKSCLCCLPWLTGRKISATDGYPRWNGHAPENISWALSTPQLQVRPPSEHPKLVASCTSSKTPSTASAGCYPSVTSRL
jgi:hypothetical protein